MVDQRQQINMLLNKLQTQSGYYTNLYNYYQGKHKILYDKPKSDPTKADPRATFNYARKTVTNFVGYLLGKPVNYTSNTDNKAFLDDIHYYFGTWEKQHNIDIKTASEVFGKAYEVYFINTDGEFQCTYFNPLEMAVLQDGTVENNVILAVRKYKIEGSETQYIEVWDNQFYYQYEESVQAKPIVKKEHRFSRCPVRKLQNNELEKSAFEDIINLIDMYNSIYSANVGEILDHRNAYLGIENANLTKEKAQEMKENGIILLPNGSKSYWIIKDINAQFVSTMIDKLKDEIYIQTNQVNLNENFQSNTSGVSIRLKLQELENLSALKESLFEKLLKDRLKFFCEWLKIAKSKSYDYRDICVTFTRNVPVDEASIAQMVVELDGQVPLEERLSWLPRITNPSESVRKLREEQDAYGVSDLDKVLSQRNGGNNEQTE